MFNHWTSALIFLCAFSAHGKSLIQSIGEQELLAHGKKVYQQRCIGCHGEKGDGKGLGAPFLNPSPRDFTSGVYKFRSTPLDTLPTDEDLMKVIGQGVLGTSMPSFSLVPEVSRLAVIQYLKTFSEAWKNPENYGVSVQGAPFPKDEFINAGKFIPRASKGRKIFLENCVTCHGRLGLGDGPGGLDLVDDWGNKIIPGDLQKPFIKSGRSVRDIHRAIMTGIGGTPMPAFKGSLEEDQLWDVTAYVLYLRGIGAGLYLNPPIAEISKKEAEEY